MEDLGCANSHESLICDDKIPPARLSKKSLILIFILILISLIGVSIWVYKYVEKQLQTQAEYILQSVSLLKTQNLIQWRTEIVSDANMLAGTLFLAEDIRKYVNNPTSTARKELFTRLQGIKNLKGYSDIFFSKLDGHILFSLSGKLVRLNSEEIPAVKAAFRERRVIFTDLHKAYDDVPIHINVVVPLFYKKQGVEKYLGALVLQLYAKDSIWPILLFSPIETKTTETLLVRRDGESVLFLNELRHKKDTAFKFRMPLSEVTLPAAMVVLGKRGIVRGKDYRSAEVLAYLNSIPDSSWFIVTKTDMDEAMADWKERSLLIIGLVVTLLTAIAAIFIALWQGYIKKQYGLINVRLNQLVKERTVKLQESEFLFRTTLYSIGEGIITADANGQLINMNHIAENLTGCQESKAKGESLAKILRIVNEESYEAIDFYNKNSASGIIDDFRKQQTILIGNDGIERPISYSSAPIKDSASETIGLVIVFRDVTEERAIKKMLTQQKESLKEAQRIAHIGNWDLDLESNLLTWSDEIYRIFEINPKEFSPSYEAFLKNIHPDDRDFVDKAYSDSIKNKTPYDIAHRLLMKDGRVKYINERCETFYSKDGKPLRSIGTVQDITERKLAEEKVTLLNAELEQRVLIRTKELETANKDLEAFTYSVSHDLRAPLRAIDGFTRILMETSSAKLDDEGKEACSIICETAERMGKLIDDLLRFSRLGTAEIKLIKTDMESMAISVFNELTTPESRKRIDFTVGPLPKVNASPDLIHQVWTNLIANAIKFSSKRERAIIEVRAEEKGGEIIYSVLDNGTGFAMKYVNKLFGVFQRLHSMKEFEGTGVGLAIVHRIITRHHGRVWAEAEPDKGAVFYFALKI